MRDMMPNDALILKKQFVFICENNLIAAFLLDKFEDDADTERLSAQLDDRDKKMLPYTYEKLVDCLYNLFPVETIVQACRFLASKQYIRIWLNDENDTCSFSTEFYYVEYQQDFVAIASRPYFEQKATIEAKRHQEWQIQHPPVPINSISQTKPMKIKLENKYKVEASRVAMHNNRAMKLELPATLTLKQWITVLDYFKWKCAYCQGKYTVLEHFIPLAHGKGTSKDNCIPSCRSCNLTKGPSHPSALSPTAQEKLGDAIKRVQSYLEELGREVEK